MKQSPRVIVIRAHKVYGALIVMRSYYFLFYFLVLSLSFGIHPQHKSVEKLKMTHVLSLSLCQFQKIMALLIHIYEHRRTLKYLMSSNRIPIFHLGLLNRLIIFLSLILKSLQFQFLIIITAATIYHLRSMITMHSTFHLK